MEDVLKTKEQEKDHLMTSYRKIIADHEKLDLTLKSSSEDGNQMRMEVVMKDKQLEHLQRSIDELTSSLNQCRIDLGAYEKQSSSKKNKKGGGRRYLDRFHNQKHFVWRFNSDTCYFRADY